jgi:Flp pilus assembly protein TadD
MMRAQRFLIAALAASSLALLTACQTDNLLAKPVDSMTGMHDAREARLNTAAATAIARGQTREALVKYAELHDAHKNDPLIAVNYAQLLRKTGDPAQAKKVLAPFMSDSASPMVRNEYAAALIATGDFAEAEKTLNAVLEDSKDAAYHNDARDLMGISLDARGQHREAEQMFRLALDGWKGNPSSVMNNLGLCLASEGMFDESLDTLRRALILAPDKEEIAKNIQIVTDLRARIVKTPAPDTGKAKSKTWTKKKKPAVKKRAAAPQTKTPCPATCPDAAKKEAPATSSAPPAADSAPH